MSAEARCCSETGGDPGVHCPLKAPNALLADFIEFYARSAARHGQRADVEALRGAAREFLRSHPLDSFAFSTCRRLLGEAEGRSLPPFERVLIEPLRPLLPRFGGSPGAAAPAAYPMLSRRVLPGLLAALTAMLGQERTEGLRFRAEALADAFLSPERGETDWAGLARDAESAAIHQDVGLAVVTHFADFERRFIWLTNVIDAHLPPAANAAEREWSFGERHAVALLLALMRPLRERRKTGGGFDVPTTVAVDAFFADLDAKAAAAKVSF